MYKQVKMWNFSSSDSGKSRCKIAQEVKAKFDILAKTIHVVSNLEAGVNINLSSDYYSLVLIIEFDNYEDMVIFHEHLEYRKIEEFMAPFIIDSKIVEYEN